MSLLEQINGYKIDTAAKSKVKP